MTEPELTTEQAVAIIRRIAEQLPGWDEDAN